MVYLYVGIRTTSAWFNNFRHRLFLYQGVLRYRCVCSCVRACHHACVQIHLIVVKLQYSAPPPLPPPPPPILCHPRLAPMKFCEQKFPFCSISVCCQFQYIDTNCILHRVALYLGLIVFRSGAGFYNVWAKQVADV